MWLGLQCLGETDIHHCFNPVWASPYVLAWLDAVWLPALQGFAFPLTQSYQLERKFNWWGACLKCTVQKTDQGCGIKQHKRMDKHIWYPFFFLLFFWLYQQQSRENKLHTVPVVGEERNRSSKIPVVCRIAANKALPIWSRTHHSHSPPILSSKCFYYTAAKSSNVQFWAEVPSQGSAVSETAWQCKQGSRRRTWNRRASIRSLKKKKKSAESWAHEDVHKSPSLWSPAQTWVQFSTCLKGKRGGVITGSVSETSPLPAWRQARLAFLALTVVHLRRGVLELIRKMQNQCGTAWLTGKWKSPICSQGGDLLTQQRSFDTWLPLWTAP